MKDGITHIIFLPCSFAIRDIFLFAHYGFLQVRQVCARRKLAHPRYVALLHNRAMIPSFAPNSRKQRLIALFLPFGAKLTVSLTLSFFPVRSLFVIFSFLLTMASFRFVRFAHGANLRTLALSLRSNAVYATSFAPNSRKQRVIALFSAVWSERRDSNPQQPAWEAGILPLNYFRLACRYYITVPFILQ